MTEAIVCAVIAAIAAVTVGIINAFSQKKTKQELSAEFQKELQVYDQRHHGFKHAQ